MRLPPVLRTSDSFIVAEFALWSGGRVADAEVKAGFGVVLDYDALAARGSRPDRRSIPTRSST